MSNETLILKTAVATNSTVKLTDCPMSSGEILEMVCRLYANGLTSGNRCFKAIGNAVTYNTDAVTEGDIYCVSYRDGGFYVGLRTTEDYEPKEGDWWCYHITSSIWECDTYFFNKNLIFNSYGLVYSVRYNGIVNNYIIQSEIQSTRGNLSKLMTNETPKRYKAVSNRYGLFTDYTTQDPWTEDVLVAGNNSIGAKDDLDVNRLPRLAMLWKPITASDILAYKVTYHMGHLMVGNASMTHPKNDSSKYIFGSDTYPSFNNTWDFNTKYLLIVTDENGNIYNLKQSSSIPFYVRLKGTSTQAAACNINVDYINGCFITTETLAEKLDEEYLDKESYTYVNGYDNQIVISTSYIIYKIPILQNNMVTPSLLSNNLNSNNIPNDETDG